MVRLLLPVILASSLGVGAVALAPRPGADRPAALASEAGPVAVTRVPVGDAVVRDSGGGTRGPSAAVLPDGRVLLGGGADGRRLLITAPDGSAVREVGTVVRASQRRDDARFAPTDIEVMSVSKKRIRLFVAYPQYLPRRACVRLAVDRVDLTNADAPRVRTQRSVFRSRPCVPPAAIQHAAGKLVRISRTRAYVTLGDLGYPGINDRTARGQLGSVLRIGVGVRPKRISQGHRNGQGLTLDRRGRLWETEHGPRGGDELNLIRAGADYGWPFVTLGEPYGGTDYVMPARTGSHDGYPEPRTAWVPSVATSEIVQVPGTWPGWSSAEGGDLLMGTLKDQAFWRIRVDRAGSVTSRERLAVGHRIRDVDVRGSRVVATTDDGTLLLLTAPA